MCLPLSYAWGMLNHIIKTNDRIILLGKVATVMPTSPLSPLPNGNKTTNAVYAGIRVHCVCLPDHLSAVRARSSDEPIDIRSIDVR
jgi:hypothetical protein